MKHNSLDQFFTSLLVGSLGTSEVFLNRKDLENAVEELTSTIRKDWDVQMEEYSPRENEVHVVVRASGEFARGQEDFAGYASSYNRYVYLKLGHPLRTIVKALDDLNNLERKIASGEKDIVQYSPDKTWEKAQVLWCLGKY